jgi:multicomponent Na+:H+ antiporter subunit G
VVANTVAVAATAGTVRPLVVATLVAVGCFFLTVGVVGLLRFPNVYNRMHATSKPTTLGTASVFLAGFVRFGPGGAGLTSLVGILFLFITVPTGAHMISRAAQRTGVPFLGGVTWPSESENEDEDSGESPESDGPHL